MNQQQSPAQDGAQSPIPNVADCSASPKTAKQFIRRSAFTMDELMEQPLPSIPELVPGIIPSGLVLLVAASKVGKSWFALALAYAAAREKYFMGSAIRPSRPVLYLALEDGPRRLQNRLNKMCAREPASNLTFRVRINPGESPTEIVEKFLQEHDKEQPLVIIDTLGKIMGFFPPRGRQGAYEHDYAMMSQLKRLSDECDGSTLLVVHHTNKAGMGDFVESVSGTNAIAGAADTILRLSRSRGETEGTLEITSRDAPEGLYAVRFDEEHGIWSLQGNGLEDSKQIAYQLQTTNGLGDLMTEIVNFVSRQESPVDAKTVAIGVHQEADVKKVQMYLKRASDRKRIKRTNRGRYAPTGYKNVETVGSVANETDSYYSQTDSTLTTLFTPFVSSAENSENAAGKKVIGGVQLVAYYPVRCGIVVPIFGERQWPVTAVVSRSRIPAKFQPPSKWRRLV